MKYDKELQELLENYLKAGDDGLSSNITAPTSDLNDELYLLGYIKKQGHKTANDREVLGLGISSKGKRFLKNGGFKRQAHIKLIKVIGSIIIFIVTVLTFIITVKDCSNKDKKIIKQETH